MALSGLLGPGGRGHTWERWKTHRDGDTSGPDTVLVGLAQDKGSTWSTVPTWPTGLEGGRGPSRGIPQHPVVGHIWVLWRSGVVFEIP